MNYVQLMHRSLKPFLIFVALSIFNISCSENDAPKMDPVITWSNPLEISVGTLLSDIQLNATSDIPGEFMYTPDIGTALGEGIEQELKVDFIPADQNTYSNASETVQITVTAGSSANFNLDLTYGTMSDVDNNVYKTITIGTQTWMAENLRTTKYRNGDDIPLVSSNNDWKNLTTPAYSTYDNTTDLEKIATYGNLYNWFAVSNPTNISPEGWHVATDAE